MSLELTAIYENGVFTPTTNVDLPERTAVELIVSTGCSKIEKTKRREDVEKLFAWIDANPVQGGVIHYCREDLHERD